MKLLPQLSSKLTTYDATEKKTVPPEQSTAAIRADIAALGMYFLLEPISLFSSRFAYFPTSLPFPTSLTAPLRTTYPLNIAGN